MPDRKKEGGAQALPEIQSLLAAVDAGRLMAHVRELTRFERSPDSADEKAAFAYLEGEVKSLGLTARRHALPAYVSMPLGAELSLAGEAFPCTSHSMLPNTDMEAELLYCPQAETFTPEKAAGKLLLTEGLATVQTLRAAEAAAAAGVIFIAGSRLYHEMIVSPVWGSPEPKDLESYLKLPAATVAYAEGERIKALLALGGAGQASDQTCGQASDHIRVKLRTRIDTHWTKLPVLTADIGDTSQEMLLLTGHVDSWHKGALDNASGNAAALEIARLLAPRAAALRRGLRLVFWSGHSHGRYAGSTAYCDEFFQELYDKAFLHVNADCLGGTGATLLTQAACMAESWGLGNFAIHSVTGETLEGSRFSRSCDQSFWGTGTPSLFSSVSEQPKPEHEDAASKAFALMFGGSKSGGYGWWWHTRADTEDKLDPAFLQRDTRIFLAAVYKACADPLIPFDIRAAFDDFAAHVRAYAHKGEAWLDFSPLLRDVERVQGLLAALDLTQWDEKAANRLILDFERKMVPLAYVKGRLCGHDPALRQAPLPLLEEVEELAAEKDPHRHKALGVLLKRRINEVRLRVRDICGLLSEYSA